MTSCYYAQQDVALPPIELSNLVFGLKNVLHVYETNWTELDKLFR